MSTLIEYADDVRGMEQKAAKERPILFSGAMVRAILSGQKTQTRRVVKHRWPHLWQEPWYATGCVLDDLPGQTGAFMEFRHRSQDESGYTGSPASTLVACPYGQPGDRLWVRESWQGDSHDFAVGILPIYAATDARTEAGWRPSIHMPRWACRIVLEIVSVRVERLNDISEADALAEGILADSFEYNGQRYFRDYRLTDAEASTQPALTCPRESFRSLWESINDPESWQANPLVWVFEFKQAPP